jgi:hypothetical protein
MINAMQLASYAMNPLLRFIRRRILLAKIGTLYRAAEQIPNGREGLKYTHTKLVNLEADLRDLGR